MSAAAITEPLILRTRMPGDKISLHGGTKKLSRLLIDLKIPASLRDTLPVVSMGDTILAVLPLRAAESHRAKPGQQALLLTIKGMEETTCIETLTM